MTDMRRSVNKLDGQRTVTPLRRAVIASIQRTKMLAKTVQGDSICEMK